MTEPASLGKARALLARAETSFRSASGLADLVQGLDLLEELIDGGAHGFGEVAVNVASAYRARLHARISELLAGSGVLPEPELQHLFSITLAFDRLSAYLPPTGRELKLELARRLIDRYYEGYPADEKQAALERLANIARGAD